VLVPHDASGLAAINWALDHPDRVAAIVALDTFYGDIAEAQLNPPEADPRRRPDARLLVGEARALATVRLRAPVKTAMLRQHPSA
jgi:pimeloyl-ACP methyl ester carboxylesterase